MVEHPLQGTRARTEVDTLLVELVLEVAVQHTLLQGAMEDMREGRPLQDLRMHPQEGMEAQGTLREELRRRTVGLGQLV